MKLSKAYHMSENWSANARAGYKAPFILLVATALVVAILLAVTPAKAAGHFQRLKSFGFPDQLVLLCYVESTKTSSNFRPQQWQKPIHRSNHGRILLSVCSHVTPEVFFGAQVDDRDE